MFGSQKQNLNSSIPILNSIGQNTLIEGSIKAEGDIRIDGIVLGNVSTNRRIVTGTKSEIEGDIICQNGYIHGKTNGVIQASEILKLGPSAVITGSIFASKLIVELGAIVQAKITMRTKNDDLAPHISQSIPTGYARKIISKKINNKSLSEA